MKDFLTTIMWKSISPEKQTQEIGLDKSGSHFIPNPKFIIGIVLYSSIELLRRSTEDGPQFLRQPSYWVRNTWRPPNGES